MPSISCRALRKVYEGAQPVVALDSVDLDVASGEFLAVVGPSGGGKSTLLHMLGGIDRPTSGAVIVSGRDIGSLSEEQLTLYRRREVGIVFQFFNLLPHISAVENVELPGALDSRPDAARVAAELLERVGMRHRAAATGADAAVRRCAIRAATAAGSPRRGLRARRRDAQLPRG